MLFGSVVRHWGGAVRPVRVCWYLVAMRHLIGVWWYPVVAIASGVVFAAVLALVLWFLDGQINGMFVILGGALFAVGCFVLLPIFVSIRATEQNTGTMTVTRTHEHAEQ